MFETVDAGRKNIDSKSLLNNNVVIICHTSWINVLRYELYTYVCGFVMLYYAYESGYDQHKIIIIVVILY